MSESEGLYRNICAVETAIEVQASSGGQINHVMPFTTSTGTRLAESSRQHTNMSEESFSEDSKEKEQDIQDDKVEYVAEDCKVKEYVAEEGKVMEYVAER